MILPALALAVGYAFGHTRGRKRIGWTIGQSMERVMIHMKIGTLTLEAAALAQQLETARKCEQALRVALGKAREARH